MGITIPANVSLTVHEESPTSLHLVLPSAGKLSEPEMAAMAGGSHCHADVAEESPTESTRWQP